MERLDADCRHGYFGERIHAKRIEKRKAGSLAHVFVEEGEDVGLPNGCAEMEEVVAIVQCFADGRIDLQAMRLAGLLAAGIEHFAGRERVIVLGVNKEIGAAILSTAARRRARNSGERSKL